MGAGERIIKKRIRPEVRQNTSVYYTILLRTTQYYRALLNTTVYYAVLLYKTIKDCVLKIKKVRTPVFNMKTSLLGTPRENFSVIVGRTPLEYSACVGGMINKWGLGKE